MKYPYPIRELYDVYTDKNGIKHVHYLGFIDADGGYETGYRVTELSFCDFAIDLVPVGRFPFDHAEAMAELVQQYIDDIDEDEYLKMLVESDRDMTYLHMDNVDEDTPDGTYYFDSNNEYFMEDHDVLMDAVNGMCVHDFGRQPILEESIEIARAVLRGEI